MVLDYLRYTQIGFLPAPQDNDDSFLERSCRTIECSEKLRQMAQAKDARLEDMLEGTADMFRLNNFHHLACKDINLKIGMYPLHFVGFHTDITKVMRKGTIYKKRSNLLGVCETLNFNGLEVPYYVIDERNAQPMTVAVHELYHCIIKAQGIKVPFSLAKYRIESMIEEFRGELLMTGEDINAYYNIKAIKENYDKVMQMISDGKVNVPHRIEHQLNTPHVRKSIYEKYQHNYKMRTYPNWNIAAKASVALASIATWMISPVFTSSILAQVLLSGGLSTAGGLVASSAIYGIYSNYMAKKANGEIINFMADTRERLDEEFGVKGANFIAYTLYLPEVKEMAKCNSAKDYLHKKGTTRTMALLLHAISLNHP